MGHPGVEAVEEYAWRSAIGRILVVEALLAQDTSRTHWFVMGTLLCDGDCVSIKQNNKLKSVQQIKICMTSKFCEALSMEA